MGLGRKTVGVIHARMADHKPFKRGNVWGTPIPGGPGWLAGKAWDDWDRDRAGPGVAYVVYSYQTPIAWLVTPAGGPAWWRIPAVRHSVSTSGHQTTVKVGADKSGEGWSP